MTTLCGEFLSNRLGDPLKHAVEDTLATKHSHSG